MKISDIRKRLLPILRRHKIAKAGVFGSAARGEMTKKSDVDILIDLREDLSLFGFVGLQLEMEKALGRKVDLVEYAAIKPSLKKYILAEEVSLL